MNTPPEQQWGNALRAYARAQRILVQAWHRHGRQTKRARKAIRLLNRLEYAYIRPRARACGVQD